MAENRRFLGMAALTGGVLAGAALPPVAMAPLLWLALVPLWAIVQRPRCRGGAVLAGVWGLGAVLVSHRWLLWLHPLDWVGVPAPLSLPLALLIWGGCGLAGGALVALWALLVRALDGRRLSTALLAGLVWGLAEVTLARGPLFWIGLGTAALPFDPPLAGLGAIGGSALVAAAQLLIGWGLWRMLQPAPQRRRRLALLALLLLALHGGGAWALAANGAAPPSSPPQRWLVLQPAIPTREKFAALQQVRLLGLLRSALSQAATTGADGLLLPEGALALGQELPEAAPVDVLSGGFRLVEVQQRSSLLRFPPGRRDAATAIDKHRLVPLGEWVPAVPWLPWSGLSAVGGVSPGAPSRLLPLPGGAIAVAICYELSDGAALARAVREGAGWLLASANLDPYPGPLRRQFTALAQQRAIETGRWLLSAANTGPSLVIDARGVARQQLPAAVPGTGLMELQPLVRLTPYVRWGEAPLLLVLALLLLGRWIAGSGGAGAAAVVGGSPGGPPAPPPG